MGDRGKCGLNNRRPCEETEKFEDAALLALKMQGGGKSQGMKKNVGLKSRKGKETYFPNSIWKKYDLTYTLISAW